jgi:hypothetical protein
MEVLNLSRPAWHISSRKHSNRNTTEGSCQSTILVPHRRPRTAVRRWRSPPGEPLLHRSWRPPPSCLATPPGEALLPRRTARGSLLPHRAVLLLAAPGCPSCSWAAHRAVLLPMGCSGCCPPARRAMHPPARVPPTATASTASGPPLPHRRPPLSHRRLPLPRPASTAAARGEPPLSLLCCIVGEN